MLRRRDRWSLGPIFVLLALGILAVSGHPLGSREWDATFGPAHLAPGTAVRDMSGLVGMRRGSQREGERGRRNFMLRQPQEGGASVEGFVAPNHAAEMRAEQKQQQGGERVGAQGGGGVDDSSSRPGENLVAGTSGSTAVAHARARRSGFHHATGKKFEMWGRGFPGGEAASSSSSSSSSSSPQLGMRESGHGSGGEITVIEEGVPSSSKAGGGVSAVAADFPKTSSPVDRNPYGGASSSSSSSSSRSAAAYVAGAAGTARGIMGGGRAGGKYAGGMFGGGRGGLAAGDSVPLEPSADDAASADDGDMGIDVGGIDVGGDHDDIPEDGYEHKNKGIDEDDEGKVIEKVFDFSKITYAEIPLHHWAWLSAVGFVILTCVISSTNILRHLEQYNRPEVQKYVVRILFMAPIYAVDALLSLTFNNAAPYINVVRDCYEAFTVYNFLKLLFELLGGERAVIKLMQSKKQTKMIFPLQWTEPWEMGDEMFYNCKFGVMQYVIVIPLCALVTFISGAAGAFEASGWHMMEMCIQFVACCSASWAIYCLVTFYMVMQGKSSQPRE